MEIISTTHWIRTELTRVVRSMIFARTNRWNIMSATMLLQHSTSEYQVEPTYSSTFMRAWLILSSRRLVLPFEAIFNCVRLILVPGISIHVSSPIRLIVNTHTWQNHGSSTGWWMQIESYHQAVRRNNIPVWVLDSRSDEGRSGSNRRRQHRQRGTRGAASILGVSQAYPYVNLPA